jgi:outer membrane protein OmpA-like peptidoglycan-associated protein
MGVKLILALQLLFSSVAYAKYDCNSAVFIKDSIEHVSSGKNDTWLKFKAKGSVLNLKIVSEKDGTQIPYTIYPSKNSCSSITNGQVRPTRTVGTGLSVLTEELWQLTLDEGVCVCDNCLSKVILSPNRNLNVQQEKMYLLKIHGHGQKVMVTSKWSNVDKNKKVFELDASNESLEVGMKFQLKTVQFVASKTDYLNRKTPEELNALFQFLEKNKSLKVVIVGHVNGPTNYNQQHFMQLSSARAKKIKDYLINRGINQSRVNSTGKSNTEMKFPRPRTEWEAQQNRRVEVEIVSF